MPIRIRSGVLGNESGWTPFIEIDGVPFGVGDGPYATEEEAELIAHDIHGKLKNKLTEDGGFFIDNPGGIG